MYSTIVYAAVFGSIMLLPLIFHFLDEYTDAMQCIVYLLISQGILAVCFAYNTISIVKKKHKIISIFSIIAALTVGILGLIVSWLQLEFTAVAIVVIAGISLFSILQTRLGEKLIGNSVSIPGIFSKVAPLKLLIPVLILSFGSIILENELRGIVAFSFFLIFSWKDIVFTFVESKKLLKWKES